MKKRFHNKHSHLVSPSNDKIPIAAALFGHREFKNKII